MDLSAKEEIMQTAMCNIIGSDLYNIKEELLDNSYKEVTFCFYKKDADIPYTFIRLITDKNIPVDIDPEKELKDVTYTKSEHTIIVTEDGIINEGVFELNCNDKTLRIDYYGYEPKYYINHTSDFPGE